MRRLDFRTVFWTVALLTVLIDVTESSLVHKAKPVRVIRAEKTQLADGTKFERYVETGQDDVPPLPEDEADDLNDPRIGHLDNKGSIIVPVDAHGNVLPGFEYLLDPIDITIDLDEQDAKSLPGADENSIVKNEFTDRQEVGEEYDDVPSEPREPAPKVPDLPKPDYSDSEESDEEPESPEAAEEDASNAGQVQEENLAKVDSDKEIDVPSTRIEPPIVTGDVEDKIVEVPSNRIEEPEVPGSAEESEGLTEEDIQQLAKEMSQDVLNNVMNKASEFLGEEKSPETSQSLGEEKSPEDPNSINYEVEQPAGDLDGVVLPEQTLSDDDIARIAAESLMPEPVEGEDPSKVIVRGGRIGSGVEPDSSSQFNIFLQFLLVSLSVFLF